MVVGVLSLLIISETCKVFKTLSDIDWTKLENKEWMEIISSSDPEPYCVVREYFPANNWTRKTTKERTEGKVVRRKKFNFSFRGDKQLLDPRGHSFEQILNTDYSTWILIHICSGLKSRLALVTRDRWSVVPEDIKQLMDTILLSSGMENTYWIGSLCSPKRGLK